jgi:hypothetical protein
MKSENKLRKEWRSCNFLFSAEVCWLLSGRSPGLEVAGFSCIAALPSPAISRVVLQSSFPHLQWRNRAGSSPDFPVMPGWAPEIVSLYHSFSTPSVSLLYARGASETSPFIDH